MEFVHRYVGFDFDTYLTPWIEADGDGYIICLDYLTDFAPNRHHETLEKDITALVELISIIKQRS